MMKLMYPFLLTGVGRDSVGAVLVVSLCSLSHEVRFYVL